MNRIVAPFALAILLTVWILAWNPQAGTPLPPASWLFAIVPSIVLSAVLLSAEARGDSRLATHGRHAAILYMLLLFGMFIQAEGMTHSAGMAVATSALSMIVGNAVVVVRRPQAPTPSSKDQSLPA